jgi:hypothetical protein
MEAQSKINQEDIINMVHAQVEAAQAEEETDFDQLD